MRGTLKHRRSAKEMKRDREDHFADLAEHEPTEKCQEVDAKRCVLCGRLLKKMGSRYERECCQWTRRY